MTERTAGSTPILLEGAIDMHCHFGPEPVVSLISGEPHAVDPIRAAQDAVDGGMRGIVLKAHEFASTMTAHLVRRVVPDIEVISSICLDHPMGGLNPWAAETALRAGAKVVWLPTISAWNANAAVLKTAFHVDEGIPVTTPDGALRDEVREIIRLVEEHDAVLATGHITRDEHFAIAAAFNRPDRLIVTHAMQKNAGPALSADDCRELADMGAVIEFSAHSCHGDPALFPEVLRAVEMIGVDRVTVSSDYGWHAEQPKPAPGLSDYLTRMWENGVAEHDLRTMSSSVPARMLGLA